MLGDAVATTVQCDNGQASIYQMDSVYQSLSSDLQASFQSAHDSLINTYNQTWYSGIDWIPFNPACGTMQQLGISADALTRQMQTAAGQQPSPGGGPSTSGQGMSLQAMIILAAVGYLGFVYLASHAGR